MNLNELKAEHPELVSQILATATEPAASIESLEAAFAGDPGFVLSCFKAGMGMNAAKAKHGEAAVVRLTAATAELTKANAEVARLTAELAEAKAQMAAQNASPAAKLSKLGVTAGAAEGIAGQIGTGGTAAPVFTRLLDEAMAQPGARLTKAVADAKKQDPKGWAVWQESGGWKKHA
jgi:hypothetical protein